MPATTKDMNSGVGCQASPGPLPPSSQRMAEAVLAAGLCYSRLQLILGSEVGITAAEIVAAGDQTRLGLESLPGTRAHIQSMNDLSDFQEALLIVDSDTDTAAGRADVEIFGMTEGTIPAGMSCLTATDRKGVLAEAAFAAWRQRLSDAADSLDPLTSSDAQIIGRIDIPGNPLITELRADRRRAAGTTSQHARSADDGKSVVDDVITDLRAAVRFGAAGLTDATDTLLAEAIELACEQSGWVKRLNLLIAAEEICAIDLLSLGSGEILRATSTYSNPLLIDQLLGRYEAEREHAEDLAALLDEVVLRLPSTPRNPATRLLRRKAVEDVRKIRQTVEAYSSVVRTRSLPKNEPVTWTAATQSLIALEGAIADESTDSENPAREQSTQSVDEAAVQLGELFAKRLPAARILMDDVARQHPGVDAEGRVQIVKRQAVRKLNNSARQDLLAQPIPEVVAELAMAIALLRGIEPRTDAEFEALGRRILTRAERIAKVQAQAGNAIPVAARGFTLFAQQIQPLIAEYLFNTLSGVKPSRPGAAREAYKTARSKIWRARRDRDSTDAMAGGASDALKRAIDAGAPRLIVRHVDRSLRGPKQ